MFFINCDAKVMGYFEICNIFVGNFEKMDKIIGMGNALVDVIATLPNNDLLEKLELPIGSMQLIDEVKLKEIQFYFKQMQTHQDTGGSAGNTIRSLAKIGVQTGFIGKIGDDEYGRFYRDSLQRNGIEAKLDVSPNEPSGIASTFISSNGERTFGTYLGAAALLTQDSIKPELFAGYQYLYIEGYLTQSHPMILHAMKLAKEQNMKICMDMSSYNIVAGDLDFFKQLIAEYVDIIFANEQEAYAYTGKGAVEALDELGEKCEIAVVKVGPEGSYIRCGAETVKVPPLSSSKAIDTNGAGDYYAAGFLYGLLQKCSIKQCGEIGSLLSGNVIQVIGTTVPQKQWDQIKLNIHGILSE